MITSNKQTFLLRFWIYQKERFPLLAHGLLISAFSFSAISYSRICRGVSGFIPFNHFVPLIVITITLFFLLRVLDEFKDKEDDALYRKHLPVPRGLIQLSELRNLGIGVVLLQLILLAWFLPSLFPLYFLVMGYLTLMSKEFFLPEWLKKHPFWYVISHMVIIPLIDVFASGADWQLDQAEAPKGLFFFLLVSFMNGIVVEVGRKIKNPEREEVNTYTTMMGTKKATQLWLFILTLTWGSSLLASDYAGYGFTGMAVLFSIFLLCAIPGILFIQQPNERNSKWVEKAAGVWTLGMYLTLGAIPMLGVLFKSIFKP